MITSPSVYLCVFVPENDSLFVFANENGFWPYTFCWTRIASNFPAQCERSTLRFTNSVNLSFHVYCWSEPHIYICIYWCTAICCAKKRKYIVTNNPKVELPNVFEVRNATRGCSWLNQHIQGAQYFMSVYSQCFIMRLTLLGRVNKRHSRDIPLDPWKAISWPKGDWDVYFWPVTEIFRLNVFGLLVKGVYTM